MEEIVDAARHIGADALDFHQVAGRRALDRLQGPEVVQQRPLARRSDPWDFLQARLADIAPAAMKIASATQRSQIPPCRMSCQYMAATTAGTAAMRA